jgi:hypothetical protein
LILAREYAIKKGYSDNQFTRALRLAINQGNLNLSDFQRNERNKLDIRRRLSLDSAMKGANSIFDVVGEK